MELEFRDPWMLWFALLAVPVFLGSRLATGRVRFSSLRLLPGKGSTTWRARLAWLPDLLVAMSMVGFAVGLAGPRTVGGETRVEREGIAIMMLVDVSGSMRALDLSEADEERTRLDVVKEVFEWFVEGNEALELEGRHDDAVGLVRFAGYADTAVPLTLDHVTLLEIADDLEIVTSRSEDGTAIGDALGLAVERLDDSESESKVAILLTDGVHNAGETTPKEAAALAEAVGVKVYTIGAGTDGLAPVRVEDPFGRSVLRRVPVQIDEETLQEIAARTGGRFFRATDAEELVEVYREIDALEKTRVIEERMVEYEEHYEVATSIALGIACLGWLLGATIFRRLP